VIDKIPTAFAKKKKRYYRYYRSDYNDRKCSDSKYLGDHIDSRYRSDRNDGKYRTDCMRRENFGR